MLADRLGFDAIVVNEHHNTVYSMMATPNLIAAALVPQTKNARICVWGTPPNFMLPNRLAEEYAILDVMSNGPAGNRVPARHRHGILVEPGQSRDGAREVQGIAQDHPAGLDGGRPDHALRHNTIRTASSIRGRGRTRSRIRPATSSAPAVRRRSRSRPSWASATRRCSSPQQRARELNESLRQRAAHYGHTHPARSAAAADLRLRRGDPGAGRAGVHRAPAALLRGLRAHHAAVPGASRLSLGRAAEDARGHGRQDARRLRLQGHQQRRSSSRSARRRRWPTRSASGRSG